MTTREKIIVGMMCITVAYGAYELISGTPAKRKPAATAVGAKPMDELRKFVADLSQKLTETKVDKQSEYFALQAATEWNKDPFIQSLEPLKSKLPEKTGTLPDLEQKTVAPVFSFNGYLQVGEMHMAVIDDMEYTVGEPLGTTGYFIRSIQPDHVLIGKEKGSETLRISLQEIDSEPLAPTQQTWK